MRYTDKSTQLVFAWLELAKTNVHECRFVCDREEDGALRFWRHNPTYGTSWDRIEPRYDYGFGQVATSCFTPKGERQACYRDKVVWIDPIRFCPTNQKYHEEGCDNSQFHELVGIADKMTGDAAWLMLCAFAQKHSTQPAFYIRRLSWRPDRDISAVGPWAFFYDSTAYHGKSKMQAHECRELKLWLHGKPSRFDPPRTVMQRAARRRVVKHRATPGDIQFFQTLFGVSEVGRWLKEANNKSAHDHARN